MTFANVAPLAIVSGGTRAVAARLHRTAPSYNGGAFRAGDRLLQPVKQATSRAGTTLAQRC